MSASGLGNGELVVGSPAFLPAYPAMTPENNQQGQLPHDHSHHQRGHEPRKNTKGSSGPVKTAIFMTGFLSLGYLGMLWLIDIRPQFIAWGLNPPEHEVYQESPIVSTRPVDAQDTAYKVKGVTSANITYDLHPNPDWRGLKQARTLSGQFRGEFRMANPSSHDEFVAFRLPFPVKTSKEGDEVSKRTQEIPATKFEVQGAPDGETQTTAAGWFWSGLLPAGGEAVIHIDYDTGHLRKGSYGLSKEAQEEPGEHEIAFSISEAVPFAVIGGLEAGKLVDESSYTWDHSLRADEGPRGISLRKGFGILDAMKRLLQLAPLVTGLYLVTLLALLTSKRTASSSEVALLGLIFGYYFPLVTYLCARFELYTSITIAFVASAAIMINYLRFLVGNRRGVIEGMVLLLLFQVIPTAMAFQQWDRGLILLSLGGIALLAIVRMQTARLQQSAMAVSAALLCLMVLQPEGQAARLQEQTGGSWKELGQALEEPASPPGDGLDLDRTQDPSTDEISNRQLITPLATYEVAMEDGYLEATAEAHAEALGHGQTTCEIMPGKTYISRMVLPKFLRPLPERKNLTLLLTGEGVGKLVLEYRSPIEKLGEARSCTLPLLKTVSGKMTLRSIHDDLTFYGGEVWSKKTSGQTTVYQVGLAGSPSLTVRWGGTPLPGSDRSPGPGFAHADRIQVIQSSHLTTIHNEMRVNHLALFELVEHHSLRTLELQIPPEYEIVTLLAQGFSVTPPLITEGLCKIPLGTCTEDPKSREIMLRLRKDLPPIGFRGTWEFLLPRTTGTEGSIQWTLAGPQHFRLRHRGSNLEIPPPPLRLAFPDYQALLGVRNSISLAGTVIAPGDLKVKLSYIQEIPHVTDGVQ